ncbi:MAG: tRNA (N6-threonylcarbamoyladenosine(37)-N6)-methyltransferase TrmO [Bryobacteraceae bacterium]
MQDSAGIEMRLKPIGVIRTPFREPAGTPIQPCMSDGAEGQVIVFDEYREGLSDLEGFERIWLLYWFHCASPARLRVQPYLDSQERGLFATRAPCRPNPIGISCVRLLAVEGNVLRIAEVDIVDGTPLLDIKPYVPRFDAYPAARAGWLASARSARCAADDRFARD